MPLSRPRWEASVTTADLKALRHGFVLKGPHIAVCLWGTGFAGRVLRRRCRRVLARILCGEGMPSMQWGSHRLGTAFWQHISCSVLWHCRFCLGAHGPIAPIYSPADAYRLLVDCIAACGRYAYQYGGSDHVYKAMRNVVIQLLDSHACVIVFASKASHYSCQLQACKLASP
jgi:hypothetical protein